MTDAEAPVVYTDTLAPGAVSDELAPVIAELGLEKKCRELADEGWTVIENAATPEFNDRLRQSVLRQAGGAPTGRGGGANLLLAKDPVFAEAVLNPNLMAIAEFSVGRGFLISQVAGSVKPQGTPGMGLHADQRWLPAPFPEHNMLLTACWACDDYTKAGGSTLVIPRTHLLKRHPNEEEIAAKDGAIAIECPAGSVAMWDGSVWHASWPREIEGQRVVCHITYTRLAMRPLEDYGPQSDALIEAHGDNMAQLLGRQDALCSQSDFDNAKLRTTFNNAKR